MGPQKVRYGLPGRVDIGGEVTARDIIIATGSVPFVPPGEQGRGGKGRAEGRGEAGRAEELCKGKGGGGRLALEDARQWGLRDWGNGHGGSAGSEARRGKRATAVGRGKGHAGLQLDDRRRPPPTFRHPVSLLSPPVLPAVPSVAPLLPNSSQSPTPMPLLLPLPNAIALTPHPSLPPSLPPSLLLGIPIDGKTVFTSDHALKLEWLPNWIAIIGSGYIGLEFSDVYTALGTEVTFIEVSGGAAGGGAYFFGGGNCRYQPKLNQTQCNGARRRAWPMLDNGVARGLGEGGGQP